MRKHLVMAIACVLVGLAIIVIPAAYEGPLLLYINEQHAIRLLDAIGLAVAVPSWLYLNVLLVRWLVRRRAAGHLDIG